jgi:hypothetical protein
MDHCFIFYTIEDYSDTADLLIRHEILNQKRRVSKFNAIT